MGNCCASLKTGNRRLSLRSYRVAPESSTHKAPTIVVDPPVNGRHPPPFASQADSEAPEEDFDDDSASSWDESCGREESDSMRCELGSRLVLPGMENGEAKNRHPPLRTASEVPVKRSRRRRKKRPNTLDVSKDNAGTKPRLLSPDSSRDEPFWIPGSLARHMGYPDPPSNSPVYGIYLYRGEDNSRPAEAQERSLLEEVMNLYDHPRSLLSSGKVLGLANENYENHKQGAAPPHIVINLDSKKVIESPISGSVNLCDNKNTLEPNLQGCDHQSPIAKSNCSSLAQIPDISIVAAASASDDANEEAEENVEVLSVSSDSSSEFTQRIYTVDNESVHKRDNIVLMNKVKVTSRKSIDSIDMNMDWEHKASPLYDQRNILNVSPVVFRSPVPRPVLVEVEPQNKCFLDEEQQMGSYFASERVHNTTSLIVLQHRDKSPKIKGQKKSVLKVEPLKKNPRAMEKELESISFKLKMKEDPLAQVEQYERSPVEEHQIGDFSGTDQPENRHCSAEGQENRSFAAEKSSLTVEKRDQDFLLVEELGEDQKRSSLHMFVEDVIDSSNNV